MDGELKTMACCGGLYVKRRERRERERDVHDASSYSCMYTKVVLVRNDEKRERERDVVLEARKITQI